MDASNKLNVQVAQIRLAGESPSLRSGTENREVGNCIRFAGCSKPTSRLIRSG